MTQVDPRGAASRTGSAAGQAKGRLYRSVATGRVYSQAERTAAARAMVAADKIRNVRTDQRIIDLAKEWKAS